MNSKNSVTNVLYEDSLGVVDFHPSSHVGIIYISEADLVANSGYKRKLAKLRKANKVKGYVIVEKTAATAQYFPALQKFCVLEIGFVLIPVSSQSEASGFLAQMVHVEGKLESNPFLKKKSNVFQDSAVLKTLQCVPKLGNIKAKQLLERFQSIYNISRATVEEVTAVVGRSRAQAIKDFFGDSERR